MIFREVFLTLAIVLLITDIVGRVIKYLGIKSDWNMGNLAMVGLKEQMKENAIPTRKKRGYRRI